MIYFTSDLHLGHEGAIGFSDRPYANVDEMNIGLIDNINGVVAAKDELWILGDFAYKISRDEVRELRRRIVCRNVHLVNGNHDKNYANDGIFQSVQDYKELKTEYGKFILFHYPILEWNAAHYGTVHLHGHIHSTGEYNKENLKEKYSERFSYGHQIDAPDLRVRVYDVGVDANGYKPISLAEIVDLMDLKKVKNS